MEQIKEKQTTSTRVFSPDTVLDVLKHEDPLFYIFHMKNYEDLLVNIDDALEAMLDCGIIKKDSSTVMIEGELKRVHFYLYNKEQYELLYDITTQVTNEDLFNVLNENLVSVDEKASADYGKAVERFESSIDKIISDIQAA